MNEKKNIKSVRDEGIVNPIDVKQYKITMQKRNYNCKLSKNGYEIVERYIPKTLLKSFFGNMLADINKLPKKQKLICEKEITQETSKYKEVVPHEETFIEFANLNYEEDQLISFINKYGLLEFYLTRGVHGYNYHKHDEIEGELLLHWYFEIWHLKRVLNLWRMLFYDEEINTDKYLDFKIIKTKNSERYKVFKRWIIPKAEEGPEPLNYRKYFKNEHYFTYSNNIDFSDYRNEYLNQRTDITNYFIENRIEHFDIALINNTRTDLITKGKNFIGEIWNQCRIFILNERRIDKCNFCNNFFFKPKIDKKYCSDACRAKDFRKKNEKEK